MGRNFIINFKNEDLSETDIYMAIDEYIDVLFANGSISERIKFEVEECYDDDDEYNNYEEEDDYSYKDYELMLKKHRGLSEVSLIKGEDKKWYFAYGLEEYEMPSNIVDFRTTFGDQTQAKHKSGFSIAFPGERFIEFIRSDGKISEKFKARISSKDMYEKCVEFASA